MAMSERAFDNGNQNQEEQSSHDIPQVEQVVTDIPSGDKLISVTLLDGQAGMDIVASPDGQYYIESVNVHESAQGRGSGAALFRWAMTYVEQQPDARFIEALLINDVSEHIARKVFGDQSVHYVVEDPRGRKPGDLGYSPETEVRLLYVLEDRIDE